MGTPKGNPYQGVKDVDHNVKLSANNYQPQETHHLLPFTKHQFWLYGTHANASLFILCTHVCCQRGVYNRMMSKKSHRNFGGVNNFATTLANL